MAKDIKDESLAHLIRADQVFDAKNDLAHSK